MAQTIREMVVTEATADRALERVFGLNTTEQAVYRELLAAERPLSAEALASELDCALATAYRYLETLADRDLVTEVTRRSEAQQPAVYEATDPEQVADHMEACVERAYREFSAQIDSFDVDDEACQALSLDDA